MLEEVALQRQILAPPLDSAVSVDYTLVAEAGVGVVDVTWNVSWGPWGEARHAETMSASHAREERNTDCLIQDLALKTHVPVHCLSLSLSLSLFLSLFLSLSLPLSPSLPPSLSKPCHLLEEWEGESNRWVDTTLLLISIHYHFEKVVQ